MLGTRLICSVVALATMWLISGIVFVTAVRGPHTVWAWCIYGSVVLAIGWVVVGLPLIGLGDSVRRVPLFLLVLAGGLGGAFVMALPAISIAIATRSFGQWDWRSANFVRWELIAFAISAAGAALYRTLLNHPLRNTSL